MTTEEILKQLNLKCKSELLGMKFELLNRAIVNNKLIDFGSTTSFIIKGVRERITPEQTHPDGSESAEYRTLIVYPDEERCKGGYGIYLGNNDRIYSANDN
jgi:hypothetical protein